MTSYWKRLPPSTEPREASAPRPQLSPPACAGEEQTTTCTGGEVRGPQKGRQELFTAAVRSHGGWQRPCSPALDTPNVSVSGWGHLQGASAPHPHTKASHIIQGLYWFGRAVFFRFALVLQCIGVTDINLQESMYS